MSPKSFFRRVAAVALSALLATSALPAAALQALSAAAPTVARADGEASTVYKVTYYGTTYTSFMYPKHGVEMTVPASITHDGTKRVYNSGDWGYSVYASEAAALSDLKGATAALESAPLATYLSDYPSATGLSSNVDDYFFAGWFTGSPNRGDGYFVTANSTITSADITSFLADGSEDDVSLMISAVYLPKDERHELEFYPDSITGDKTATALTQTYNVATNSLVLSGADTGSVEAVPVDYYHIVSWDWHLDNYVSTTGVAGDEETEQLSSGSSVLTKAQIEAFLQKHAPGELLVTQGYRSAHIAPKREANTLSVTFHSGTQANAVSLPYNIVRDFDLGETRARPSGSTTSTATVPIPTLATLQAAGESATATAFAAPANMKFDGWYASTTALAVGAAVPASAAAAGDNAMADDADAYDAILKTEASTTLHLYPIWISDALGWVKDSAGHISYYEDVNGTKTPATDQRIIGGQAFLFDSNGHLQTGWVGTGASRRYYVPDKGQSPYYTGAMATDGLRTVDNDTYYFKATGAMATNETITTNAKTYYFGADGTRQVGLIGEGTAARYYDPNADGAMVTNKLVTVGTDRYYFRGNGTMAVSEAVRVDDKTYYFGADGKVTTGWVGTGEAARYYDPAQMGAMATNGKLTIGADDWFFYEDGSHAVSKIEASGDNLYYFGADGKMVRSQKVTVNDVEYTADATGALTWDFKAQHSGFTLGRDNNGFIHSNSTGWGARAGFQGHSTYKISDEMYRKLVATASWGDRWSIEWLMNRKWGGSCYGIAVTMGLLFEGKMTTSDFTSNGSATNYYTLPIPYTETKTIDTINYFMLSQLLSRFNRWSYSSSYTDAASKSLTNYNGRTDSLDVFLRELVTNPGGESVRLLCYFVHGWGHAILVTGVDFDPTQNKYTVQLYDMNSVGSSGNGSFRTMTVDTDFRGFSFRDGNNTLINTDNFQSLYVGSIAGFDVINPRKISVSSLGVASAEPRELDVAADGSSANHAFLALSLDDDFTLANAAGQTLVNKNGELSGDLPVYNASPLPMDDESLYLLEVDAGTLTVKESAGTLDLMMRDDDHFLAFEGDHVSTAELDLASERIDVQGDRVEFIAHVATEKSDEGLLAVSGIASSGMTVAKAGKSVNVSAKGEGSLTNVEVSAYNGSSVATRTFSDPAKGFHVTAGQDVNDLPANLDETGLSDGKDDEVTANGWQMIGGKRYYRENSTTVNGWKKIDGAWYYFDPSDRGALSYGWVQDDGWYFCDRTSGAMRTGWVMDGNEWYWLSPATGLMAQGAWVSYGGAWYWLRASDGVMASGWVADGGSWYYLGADGAMRTGWVLEGGVWYWLVPGDGRMATGWTVADGVWYHFSESGALSVSTWVGNDHVDAEGRWDSSR